MLVQAIETRLKQIIMPVCQKHQAEIEELEVLKDHVQRHGKSRSALGHASLGQADQGAFIPLLASGISGAQAQPKKPTTTCLFLGVEPIHKHAQLTRTEGLRHAKNIPS